jgi:hypothetical protein
MKYFFPCGNKTRKEKGISPLAGRHLPRDRFLFLARGNVSLCPSVCICVYLWAMIFLFELSALSFELVSKFKDKHLRSKSKYIAQGGNLCWRWDRAVNKKRGYEQDS